MSGVLLADRYMSPMTEGDLDEVAAIEKIAYEFPWSRGNFGDSLRNGYFGVCLRHVTGHADRLLRADAGRRRNASAQSVRARRRRKRAGAGLALLREAVRITRAEKLDGLLAGSAAVESSGDPACTSASALLRSAGAKIIIRRGIAAGRTPS